MAESPTQAVRQILAGWDDSRVRERIDTLGERIAVQSAQAAEVLDLLEQDGSIEAPTLRGDLLIRIARGDETPRWKQKDRKSQSETMDSDELGRRAAELLDHGDPFVRGLAEWGMAIRMAAEYECAEDRVNGRRVAKAWPGEKGPAWYREWQKTTGQMGLAVGAAAFLCQKHDTTPRGVYQRHLAELQDIVFERGEHANDLQPADAQQAKKRNQSPQENRHGQIGLWAWDGYFSNFSQELIALGRGEVLRASDGTVVADLFPYQDRCDCYVNYFGMNSPVASVASVYFVDATPNTATVAPTVQRFDWKPASEGRTEFVRRWQVTVPNGKYFASPVLHDGRLYLVASTLRHRGEKGYDPMLNRRVDGTLIALSAETGELLFAHEIGKETGTYHTVTFAGGRLWITGHSGVTVVVEAGQSYRELARNRLETTRSQPLFLGNDLIIRGCENLYQIGGGR